MTRRGHVVKQLSLVVLMGAVMTSGARSGARSVLGEGSGPPTLVLLHGYGCSAVAWQPFTKTIVLTAGGRFIFPQAPLTMSVDGPDTKRAWWRFNLLSYVRQGEALPDLSHAQPPGIRSAATRVRAVLRQVDRPGERPILGGFSQGAMVASEVAFTSSEPLAALVILSGTIVDEPRWRAGFARRAGLPVFVAHGRSDATLSFAIAARFAAELEAAGMNVTWVPFDGGHEIPVAVVAALNRFLAGVSGEPSRPRALHASAL